MIVRGIVQNGMVVLADGVRLPDGCAVTVLAPSAANVSDPQGTLLGVSKERHEALLQLIGLCKTDFPPDDERVDQILEQEWMKKYG